eukprot:12028340-Heterocapsa_arctica.AAC.1
MPRAHSRLHFVDQNRTRFTLCSWRWTASPDNFMDPPDTVALLCAKCRIRAAFMLAHQAAIELSSSGTSSNSNSGESSSREAQLG